MKKIFHLLILMLPFFTEGQQQYFSKRFDFNSSSENGFHILPHDTGYIAWFQSSLSPTSSRYNIVVAFIDSFGDATDIKIIDIPNRSLYLGNHGTICRTSDNAYANGGSIQDTTGNVNVLLTRYNNIGDTLWTREFGDSKFQSAWQCKQTRDGGFIITGGTGTYDTTWGDVLLLKTDSNGTFQWEQHFGGNSEDLAVSIDTCIDGGFIMAGRTRSYGVHSHTPFKNTYLVKTDSLGNFQWDKVLGGYLNDEFWKVIQSEDGYIYAFGFRGISGDSNFCCSQYNKSYVLKLDTGGNIQWEKYFGDSIYDYVTWTAEKLSDGSFIMGGAGADSFSYNGIMMRINSQGDNLFYRMYRHTGFISDESHSYFYDITEDKDKGYICTGFVAPFLPDTGHQDIWILKLDSNGCESANCLYTSLEEADKESASLINVFPVPSSTEINVRVTIPPEVKNAELIMYDFFGRKISTKRISSREKDFTFKVPIAELEAGVYFVSLYCDGVNRSTVRVLKSD